MPCVGRWLPTKGHSNVQHYRFALKRLEVDDIRWCTYNDRREALPFKEIYIYSGWVLYGKQRVYRHLHKRVKRQYECEQDIPRHLSVVGPIPIDQVVQAFLDYRVWCIHEDQWGPRDRPWQHVPGYIAWHVRVCHPKILPPEDGSPSRPTNRKQLIEEEHAWIVLGWQIGRWPTGTS